MAIAIRIMAAAFTSAAATEVDTVAGIEVDTGMQRLAAVAAIGAGAAIVMVVAATLLAAVVTGGNHPIQESKHETARRITPRRSCFMSAFIGKAAVRTDSDSSAS
jgi:hypothetical protein